MVWNGDDIIFCECKIHMNYPKKKYFASHSFNLKTYKILSIQPLKGIIFAMLEKNIQYCLYEKVIFFYAFLYTINLFGYLRMGMRKDYMDVEKMTASVFQNVSRLKILLLNKPPKINRIFLPNDKC